MTLPAYKTACLLSTVGLWFGFSYVNPFYKSLLEEKEQLLRNLDGKIGVKMLGLNTTSSLMRAIMYSKISCW